MDDVRIRNIATALCRAARINPDMPAIRCSVVSTSRSSLEATAPAWKMFEQEAERFCLQRSEAAGGIEGRPR